MARTAYSVGSYGGALTIEPPTGFSFTVNITGGTVTSDTAGTTVVTFPQTVSSNTTYYAVEGQTLSVSAKWNNVEVANGNGGAFTWTPKDGQAITITPHPTIEQGELVGGSATSGLPATIVSKTASYTASSGDFVECDTSGGGFTVTLPAAPAAGALVAVKKVSSDSNTLTIAPSGGGTIDGDANATAVTQWAGAVFEHKVSNVWRVASVMTSGTTGVGVLLASNNLSDVGSAVTARNNLLPAQASNAGKVLTTDGTNASWSTVGGSSGLIAITKYGPNPGVDRTTTSTTLADLDATNLAVTFTTPASGNVLVVLHAFAYNSANTDYWWGLREGTTNVARCEAAWVNSGMRITVRFYLTGLSAGSHTYKWAGQATSGSTAHLPVDDGLVGQCGPALMEVWAA